MMFFVRSFREGSGPGGPWGVVERFMNAEEVQENIPGVIEEAVRYDEWSRSSIIMASIELLHVWGQLRRLILLAWGQKHIWWSMKKKLDKKKINLSAHNQTKLSVSSALSCTLGERLQLCKEHTGQTAPRSWEERFEHVCFLHLSFWSAAPWPAPSCGSRRDSCTLGTVWCSLQESGNVSWCVSSEELTSGSLNSI